MADLPREASVLEAQLASTGDLRKVASWRPLTGGRSATSVLVTFVGPNGTSRSVLHLQPNSGPLAGIADARRQYRLLAALAATSVPAPRPRKWFDSEVFGYPAFLTDFIEGDVPDPFRQSGRERIAQARELLTDSILEHLVGVHSLPVQGLQPATAWPDPSQPFLQRERSRWAGAIATCGRFEHDPLLAYADGWLAGRSHPTYVPALVHGDYRPGNLVLDGGEVVGVLDWELADIGDAIYDLATLCSPPLEIDGFAAGLADSETLVAKYESISDSRVDRETFTTYSVLATFKILALWANASRGVKANTADLSAVRAVYSAAMVRPMLARTLGLTFDTRYVDEVLRSVANEFRAGLPELPGTSHPRSYSLALGILDGRARMRPAFREETLSAIRELLREFRKVSEFGAGDHDLALLPVAARSIASGDRIPDRFRSELEEQLRAVLGLVVSDSVDPFA